MHLNILPIDLSDDELLDNLAHTLKDIFKLPVFFYHGSFSLSEGWDPNRDQYNSAWLLSQIIKYSPEDSSKNLGVTTVDLYAPVLTYVFGSARLHGKAAVVSTYRLRDELYNLPRNPHRLSERLQKVAIHELGHTFGLVHCQNPRCVMFSTTYAEEVDFKSVNFCRLCSSLLENKKEQSV